MKSLNLALFLCFNLMVNANAENNIVAVQVLENHLFFIYGQSNGAGGAQDIDTTPAQTGELWDVWQKRPVILKDPTRFDSVYKGSAWPTFADEYYRLSGNTAIILNAAYGGRDMAELRPGTVSNDESMTRLREALAYYQNIGKQIKSVSMIFVHGESDSWWDTPYDMYFEGLAGISDQLKAITPLYIVSYIHRVGGYRSVSIPIQERFRNLGHEMIERTKTRIDWKPVYVKALSYDQINGLAGSDFDLHYSHAGNVKMGREMAANIHKYQSGMDVSADLYAENKLITQRDLARTTAGAISVLLHYLRKK